MKKTALIILIMTLLFLWGCAADKPQKEVSDNESTSVTTEAETTESETAESDAADTEEQETVLRESLTEKYTREIEDSMKKEEKKPESSTTVGMVDLAHKYAQMWTDVADEYYNKIMEYDDRIQLSEYYYTSEDMHTFVSDMKINWEQYKEADCTAYFETLKYIYGSGTIVGPLMAYYEYGMEKEWALKILNICEQLGIE